MNKDRFSNDMQEFLSKVSDTVSWSGEFLGEAFEAYIIIDDVSLPLEDYLKITPNCHPSFGIRGVEYEPSRKLIFSKTISSVDTAKFDIEIVSLEYPDTAENITRKQFKFEDNAWCSYIHTDYSADALLQVEDDLVCPFFNFILIEKGNFPISKLQPKDIAVFCIEIFDGDGCLLSINRKFLPVAPTAVRSKP